MSFLPCWRSGSRRRVFPWREAPILVLFLGLAGSGAAWATPPAAPLVWVPSEAPGPQQLPSCKEDLAALKTPPTRPPGPVHRGAVPKGDPQTMPLLQLDNPAHLPGASPDGLPLRRLEGPPVVLARIRNVLRRAKADERIRISVFGASHTGGDRWTGRIRRVLQERWGDGGHGFVLPAALYRGHRGHDVNLCRTDGWLSDWWNKANGHDDGLLGFAGMSVSSSNPDDFGWIQTTTHNPQGRKVDRFEVFALGQPRGGEVLLSVDGGKPHPISTHRATPSLQHVSVQVPSGGHRLRLAPTGNGEVRLFGVSMEQSGPGVVVDAMGIRGRQARSWLGWNEGLFSTGLGILKPDVVVLAYGTNEAADPSYSMESYRADLDAVLTRLRRAIDPAVPCILAGPSDRFVKVDAAEYAIWDRTSAVAQVQRSVAGRHGCAFWDWQEATGGPGSMVGWRHHTPALAAGDGIHHTAAGYTQVADQFIAALDALETDPILSALP